ncbi:MAG: hypothetical protein RR928_08420 [Comamonas sp.]|uniref:hypothetical protein n=1 Tax=Comamonas sp. TaxID=34028 RepID=UPI002FC9129A
MPPGKRRALDEDQGINALIAKVEKPKVGIRARVNTGDCGLEKHCACTCRRTWEWQGIKWVVVLT